MRTANENVLRLLAKVMADARAGNVEAVLIIPVTPEGAPDVVFGGSMDLMPSVNLGADMFKHQLMVQATMIEHKPTTSIVRPVGVC